MTIMQTSKQGCFNINAPVAEAVEKTVVAHHLARINRWAGATVYPWSVAAHSLLVAALMAEDKQPARVRLLGLLHDAHEAYTGDLSTPFQQALEAECPGAQAAIKRIQARHDRVIFPAFGLDPMPSEAERAICKSYDLLALGIEARDLLKGGPLPALEDYLDRVAGNWRARAWPDGLAELLGKPVYTAIPYVNFSQGIVGRSWLHACEDALEVVTREFADSEGAK